MPSFGVLSQIQKKTFISKIQENELLQNVQLCATVHASYHDFIHTLVRIPFAAIFADIPRGCTVFYFHTHTKFLLN